MVARAAGGPLPVHARKFLESLPKMTAEAVAAALRPLLQNVAEVTRARRAVLVAGCLAFPVFIGVVVLVGTRLMSRWQQSQPEIVQLSQVLNIRSAQRMGFMPKAMRQVDDRLYSIYIARHYRAAITNAASWNSSTASLMVQGPNRKFAEKSVADYPNPTSNEVAEATAALGKYIPSVEAMAMQRSMQESWWMPLVQGGGVLLLCVCIPAMIAALAFRGGLMMLICGVAVVRKDGRPASRGRVFWRSIVAWSPVWFGPILLALLIPLQAGLRAGLTRKNVPKPVAVMEAPVRIDAAAPVARTVTSAPATSPAKHADKPTESEELVFIVWGLVAGLLVVGSVAWSLALRDRSLQDRIAGTTLVPR
jgi:hypothetical protein